MVEGEEGAELEPDGRGVSVGVIDGATGARLMTAVLRAGPGAGVENF